MPHQHATFKQFYDYRVLISKPKLNIFSNKVRMSEGLQAVAETGKRRYIDAYSNLSETEATALANKIQNTAPAFLRILNV